MRKVLNFGTKQVVIMSDESGDSPRNWDNLGKCIFFSGNYDFGDEHWFDLNDYNDFEELEKDLVKNHDAVVVLPVYIYDHSGITIKTSPFGCSWDSGLLGFIVAFRQDVIKEYDVKTRISAKVKKTVTKVLESEISILNQFISNDVYSFDLIDLKTGETIDSCGGFYGDSADNGIFDHLSIEDVNFETYEKSFNEAEWEFETMKY